MLPVHFSICWSPSFHVPVLWFEAYRPSGSPLLLEEIASSTIFHRETPLDVPSYPMSTLGAARSAPDELGTATMPFISQTEHPVTGRMSWFLHPCETDGFVREILEQEEKARVDGDRCARASSGRNNNDDDVDGSVRWFETWLMVVASVVDLRS
ncbi:hypothetical protein JCM10212_002003 [Sporobolomyces blumeae]